MTGPCPACGHKSEHAHHGGVIMECGLCDCTETYCGHSDCVCTNKDRLIAELREEVDALTWKITVGGNLLD